jgi:DNA helicase II / ATP-dependent DNA helicase PcrA
MDREDIFEQPTITDEDICHASRLLGLSVDAFYGTDGTDPRQEVLKYMDSVDVAACPGSGKTTLLVAKLAILAEKWQYRTRGICVLSHTNAARHEIEKHLGNTATGRRLLGYPHYIGTIHGFVNEFLALPLLRSRGYSSTRFDTDISGHKILRLSSGGKKLPKCLYHKIPNEELRILAVCRAHYVGDNRDILLCAGNVNLNLKRSDQDAFKQIDAWKRAILRDGYASYEDTFAYGHYTLKKYPALAKTIRDRFPLLFIDESQDNSKEQSAILSRIFMEEGNAVIRQRFGDANQAIFEFLGAEEASTDKFPDATNKKELPNSYRFGQTIAEMADPLGLYPYGLQGIGPKNVLSSGSLEGQHTIFLFDENGAAKVLDAYGELLLETFTDFELREEWFVATAVGQVHKPKKDEDENHNVPKHIGHYWSDYDPELTKHDPTPPTFMQYVFSGQGKSEIQHETHAMVEKIAEGFLRLSDFTTGEKSRARPKYPHRHILQLLEISPEIREQYQNLIVQFTVKQEIPTMETWRCHFRGIVRSIAEAIAGSLLSEEADVFLMWDNKPVTPETPSDASRSQNNIFRYRKNGREVSIQAGSIHSVKGQTHTATLVLETYWHEHNLQHLLPWLTKKKIGWKKADKVRQEARLKLHYVAMTRPTHLLCLAMKQGVLNDEQMNALRTRGWRLLQV